MKALDQPLDLSVQAMPHEAHGAFGQPGERW